MSSQPPFDPQDLLPKRYTPRSRSSASASASASASSSSDAPPSASRTPTQPQPGNPMPDRQRSPTNPSSSSAAAASSSRARPSSKRPSFTRSQTTSIDEPKPFLPRAHNLSPEEWKRESELFCKHYLPLVKQGINIEPLVLANARAAAAAQGLKKPSRAVPPLIIPPSALPEYKHLFPSDPSAPKSPQALAAAAVSAAVTQAPAPQPHPSRAGPSRPSPSVADARAQPIRQPVPPSNLRRPAPPNSHRRPTPPHQYDPNYFQPHHQQPIPQRFVPNAQIPGVPSRRAPVSPHAVRMRRHMPPVHSIPQLPIHPKAILRSGNHPYSSQFDQSLLSCSPTAAVASAAAARGRMHALTPSRGAAASPRGRSVSRGGRGGSRVPMPPSASQRRLVSSSRAASSASSSSERRRHSTSSSSVSGSGGRPSAAP